ncbi:alpha-ribazole phosphatase family protein [Pararhodobacter sp. CCB-MM2]|uniref:alpha-ribazole phosphatase family protein n=1 Tax=Pararhodobacter sp. CCB-MM2 TaxID=1786003 RepID=UPI00082E8E45|nr:alpha-ribazole phosphatase family protein [Pararhodobacter sp. CCB-MM2]MCA2010334.1 alpha-ribazole phosphatase family protein [Cereibacter sphaeroides]
MSLILLRHTRPDVDEGICYGRTDLSLCDDFDAEVERIDAELPDFTTIIASPLSRCLRLARALGERREIEVTVDTRVIEMNFGRWERMPWEIIPRDQLDAWRDNFLGAAPHGGESVKQLATRVQAALAEVARGPVPALVVTHAGVIKAALSAVGEADAWNAKTEFGHWRRITWPAL